MCRTKVRCIPCTLTLSRYRRLFSFDSTRFSFEKITDKRMRLHGCFPEIIDSVRHTCWVDEVTSANVDTSGSNCTPLDKQKHPSPRVYADNRDSVKKTCLPDDCIEWCN